MLAEALACHEKGSVSGRRMALAEDGQGEFFHDFLGILQRGNAGGVYSEVRFGQFGGVENALGFQLTEKFERDEFFVISPLWRVNATLEFGWVAGHLDKEHVAVEGRERTHHVFYETLLDRIFRVERENKRRKGNSCGFFENREPDGLA